MPESQMAHLCRSRARDGWRECNVPVQASESTRASLPADRSRGIVVYCRSGMRSARARTLLLKAGFAQVEDLGAMSNWKTQTVP